MYRFLAFEILIQWIWGEAQISWGGKAIVFLKMLMFPDGQPLDRAPSLPQGPGMSPKYGSNLGPGNEQCTNEGMMKMIPTSFSLIQIFFSVFTVNYFLKKILALKR